MARAWTLQPFARIVAMTSTVLAEQVERFLQEFKVGTADLRVAASLAETLTRYALRATTRATPFGALSGLTTAPVTPNPFAVRWAGPMTLQALPDPALAHRLVHHLLSIPAARSALSYRRNAAITVLGERLILDAALATETTTAPHVSRPASRARRNVLDFARLPRSYAELQRHLLSLGAAADAVPRFLDDLIEQGFLLCTLRPPQTSGDPLDHVLRQWPPSGAETFHAALLELQSLVVAFNQADVDTQWKLYSGLGQARQAVVDSGKTEVPLLGHLSLSPDSSIPEGWVQQLEPALEVLLRLQGDARNPHLSRYAQEFEARYGEREVALLDLTDPERGLGALPGEQFGQPPPEGVTPLTNTAADRLLLQLAAEALYRSALEVTLQLEDIRKVLPQPISFPASADALVRPRSTGDPDLLLAPAGFMVPAGRVLGRFALNLTGLRPVLQELAEQDRQLHAAAGVLVADVLFGARTPELNVLMSHPELYPVKVAAALPSEPEAHDLDDIQVGLRNERFYLRFKSSGQEFVTRTLHAVVESAAPHAVRLLQELGREQGVSGYRWDWGSAAALPRTPRVRIGPVVLSPARWRVPEAFAGQKTLGVAFDAWCAEWEVPLWVAVGEFDQKLPLNRDLPLHRRLLLRELQRGAAFLEEVWEQPGQGAMTAPGGYRPVEVLLPMRLIHLAPLVPVPALHQIVKAWPGNPEELRPGGPCLYLKIYGPRGEQDVVLRAVTSALPVELHWFFVRYQDPRHHLRLRVFGPPGQLWSEVLLRLTEALERLVRQDQVWSFLLDTYVREVNRYGGWGGMLAAEPLFGVDSRHALAEREQRRVDWPLSVTLSRTVDQFTRVFQPDPNRRALLYAAIHAGRSISPELTRQWSAEYGRQRERITSLFQQDLKSTTWSAEAGPFAEAIRRLDVDGQLTAPLDEILPSLIHMHCNRMGADQAQEWLTLFYLKKLMAGFQHYRPSAVQL